MATNKLAAAAEAAKKAGQDDGYTVLANLQHDGEDFTPGDRVILDPISAAPLLAAGVVKPAGES